MVSRTRSRSRITVAAVAIAALLVSSTFWWRATEGGSDSQSPSAADGEGTRQAESPTILVAFPRSADNEDTVQLFLASDIGEPAPLGDPGKFVALQFSPGGMKLATLERDQPPKGIAAQVRIFDIQSGQVVTTGLARDAMPSFISWSATGDYLAVVGASTVILDASGNLVAVSVRGPRVDADGSRSVTGGGWGWSPDGAQFVSITNGVIEIFSAETRKLMSLDVDSATGSLGASNVTLQGFTAAGTVFATFQQGGAALGLLVNTDGTFREVGAEESHIPRGFAGVSAESRDIALAAHPGLSDAGSRVASDQSIELFELRSDGPNLLVAVRSGAVIFEVEELSHLTKGGHLYDAVSLAD